MYAAPICSISICLLPVSLRIFGSSQGLLQLIAYCIVPTLSRWHTDPWLKATNGSPCFLISSCRPFVSLSPILPAVSQALRFSISQIAVYPATQDIGVAAIVPPQSAFLTFLPDESSPAPRCAMQSAWPPMPPAPGYPPAMTLPKTVRSGSIPKYPCAPPSPMRNPVTTSSHTSKAPYSWASHPK